MKEPTTGFSIDRQNRISINREFLLSKGWTLIEEYPLFEVYSKGDNYRCSIGLYGEFSISELHWMNKTPEKYFSTCNPDLTIEDYNTIIKMLNINI